MLLRSADAALYRAKREGRDRALIASASETSEAAGPRSAAQRRQRSS